MKSLEVLNAISKVASRQHGVVSTDQLRRAGASRSSIRTLEDNGVLTRSGVNVWRMPSAPSSVRSTLWEYLLDVGADALASHETAAALFGIPGFSLGDPFHLIGTRQRRHRQLGFGCVLHEPVLMRPSHATEIDHIPITTPARTMFDLAGMRTVSTRRLARTIDHALARNLTSAAQLEILLKQLAKRGRPGIRRIRVLIHERLGDYIAPESGAEGRFMELLEQWGIGGFERQANIVTDAGWVGRVDFCDSRRRLIVEIDSALYHGSITDRKHDQGRHQQLAEAGYLVLSIDSEDLFTAPSAVGVKLEKAIEQCETAHRPFSA